MQLYCRAIESVIVLRVKMFGSLVCGSNKWFCLNETRGHAHVHL